MALTLSLDKTSVQTNETVTATVSWDYSLLGDSVLDLWVAWGDGTTSHYPTLIPLSGTWSVAHQFANAGTYNVQAFADVLLFDGSEINDSSSIVTVTVVAPAAVTLIVISPSVWSQIPLM